MVGRVAEMEGAGDVSRSISILQARKQHIHKNTMRKGVALRYFRRQGDEPTGVSPADGFVVLIKQEAFQVRE